MKLSTPRRFVQTAEGCRKRGKNRLAIASGGRRRWHRRRASFFRLRRNDRKKQGTMVQGRDEGRPLYTIQKKERRADAGKCKGSDGRRETEKVTKHEKKK